MKLNELEIGKHARILGVGGEGPLRLRLLDMGLTPRTAVMVRKVAPMGDPLELHIRGYELSIRLDDAKNIEVELIDENIFCAGCGHSSCCGNKGTEAR